MTAPKYTATGPHVQTADMFRLMVLAVRDYAIYMLDTDGNIISWNVGAERITGYTEEEILGKHFSIFYREEEKKRNHPAFELEQALLHGHYEEEGWRVRNDKSQFWSSVTITPVFDEQAVHRGFTKVVRDLSERLNAAEQLRRSNENFRLMVDAVKDYAIFLLDPNGHIVTWNEGAKRIKGYLAEEIIGKHFSIFYAEEAKAVNHPQRELELAIQNGFYEEEGWRLRKSGEFFWASVNITPVHDDRGLLRGFVKVTRDLTERRIAELEREKARVDALEASALKSQFVANVSHEIRTPMAGIIAMAEELLLDDDLSESQKESAENLLNSSMRLLQVLNDILDFSKLDAGKVTVKKTKFKLRKLLKDAMDTTSPYAAKKAIELNLAVQDSLPDEVELDETKIRQILVNLIHNAIKFSSEGEVRVNITENDGSVRFSVKDQGIGIAEESLKQLFQPFVQVDGSTRRKYGGTGLGLSIAKRYAELMDGEIGCNSEVGKGSEFWFTIPLEARTQ